MNRAWSWRRRNIRVRRYWPDEPGIWRLFREQAREHTGDPCVCTARTGEHPWAPGACTGVVPVVPLGTLRVG